MRTCDDKSSDHCGSICRAENATPCHRGLGMPQAFSLTVERTVTGHKIQLRNRNIQRQSLGIDARLRSLPIFLFRNSKRISHLIETLLQLKVDILQMERRKPTEKMDKTIYRRNKLISLECDYCEKY